MQPIYNKIAILYSFEQKAFHLETLGEYCKSNIAATEKKKSHQYRLIGIASTYESADESIKQIRQKFNW